MNFTIEEIAKMIDHALLHPTLTDTEFMEGCQLALKYNVATVCVKPYHVKLAANLTKNSDVKVCAVIGFPAGNSTTSIKVAETRRACKDGAAEIDMVINIGKALTEDWSYIKREIKLINNECKKHGAILKVIFENDYLPQKRFKTQLCKICSKIEVGFVKTSTGFGFVKQPDGDYNYKGATESDLILMRKYAAPSVQIKAAGGIRTLDELLRAKEIGCTRIGTSSTAALLEEAKARLGLKAEVVAATNAGY